MKTFILSIALLFLALPADATKRSTAARVAFAKAHACPSTGKPRLPCPGYVIDHIKPLACGGPDKPSNMQWQTVAEGKAKDKWERKGCQP
jgi:hypothetical protein